MAEDSGRAKSSEAVDVLDAILTVPGVTGALLTTLRGSPRATSGTLSEEENRLLPFLILHAACVERAARSNLKTAAVATNDRHLYALSVRAGHLGVAARFDVGVERLVSTLHHWHRGRTR